MKKTEAEKDEWWEAFVEKRQAEGNPLPDSATSVKRLKIPSVSISKECLDAHRRQLNGDPSLKNVIFG